MRSGRLTAQIKTHRRVIMHELTELKRKRDTYLTTAQNVVAKAIGESRGLSPDEQRDVTGLREKAAGVTETIKQFEELRGLTTDTSTANHGGRLIPGAGAAATSGPFQSLGEQLRAVISAGSEGRQTDPRLFEVRGVASGLSEKVPGDGGFLVQQDWSTSLLNAGMAQAQLAARCNPFPIGPDSNGISLPCVNETSRVTGSRFGGVRLYFADEADSLTPTKPQFRMINLKLNKLTGLCYLTDEIMQDATALQAFVERAFASEFGWVIDNCIFRGPGAGQPLGFLNSPALISIPKETGQAAATICTENITKMYARSTAPDKSIWVANIACFPQLATLQVAIGTAGALVGLLQNGIAGSPSGLGLYGRPLIWAEQSSALGDCGDLAFLDLSRYLLATKGGLQTAQSIHVRFLQDESVLRFIYRIDGQPDLVSAITPAYGTATVSPFVTIAAR